MDVSIEELIFPLVPRSSQRRGRATLPVLDGVSSCLGSHMMALTDVSWEQRVLNACCRVSFRPPRHLQQQQSDSCSKKGTPAPSCDLSAGSQIVSAQGPVADAEEEQIRLWWDTHAAELPAVAQDQNVVLLTDANASLNDEAGIHCGGSEATKENVAGTALKELVAERALCIPQTFSKFGPTWRNRRLDFIAVPLDWHVAVSDIKVEPPELLAINGGSSGSHDHRHLAPGEMSVNFERAAILTPEAKVQFERIWAQAPTPPASWAPGID